MWEKHTGYFGTAHLLLSLRKSDSVSQGEESRPSQSEGYPWKPLHSSELHSLSYVWHKEKLYFLFSKCELDICGLEAESEVCKDSMKMRTTGGKGPVLSPPGAAITYSQGVNSASPIEMRDS